MQHIDTDIIPEMVTLWGERYHYILLNPPDRIFGYSVDPESMWPRGNVLKFWPDVKALDPERAKRLLIMADTHQDSEIGAERAGKCYVYRMPYTQEIIAICVPEGLDMSSPGVYDDSRLLPAVQAKGALEKVYRTFLQCHPVYHAIYALSTTEFDLAAFNWAARYYNVAEPRVENIVSQSVLWDNEVRSRRHARKENTFTNRVIYPLKHKLHCLWGGGYR